MIKFIHTPNIKRSILLLLIPALFLAACKKDKVIHKTDNNKPTVTLPDEVMFVGTQNTDSNKYTIYLLNAATGQLVTRYNYPGDGHSNFCKPFARNGLLYDVQRDKISAITMNTGVVLWTDTVDMNTDEASIILHDDTFYGITLNHDGTSGGDFVYALDATKKSNSFLWKTLLALGGNGYNTPINYYNGIVYVTDMDGSGLTALDAKTGAVKWNITSNSSSYSLALLNNGIIIADHTIIDAVSGSQIVTVTDPAIPPIAAGATQTSSSLSYVTSDRYFVETTQAAGALQWSFLSAVDRATGTEKWRADFGSVTWDGANRTETVKSIRFILNNKLIVEEFTETYSAPTGGWGSGFPVFVSRTGGFSTLDINTGLFEGIAGGEINIADGFIQNDDNGNIVVNNIMYGNYSPLAGNSINVYATDLSTGQLKWHSTPLSYSGIYGVFTCLFSRSQNKAYSPYINIHPHARASNRVFSKTGYLNEGHKRGGLR